jgi:hypothetical protein
MRTWCEYLSLGWIVAAALLAAGCGGDDSAPIESVQDTNQTPTALSKSAFIARGDAICGEANAALSALDAPTAGTDPNVQATQELQIRRSELQSLQSLTPPEEDRSVLERFLAALQDRVDALSRKKIAVEQGGDPAPADAQASGAASSAQAAAQDYGFEDCANASGAVPAGGTTTAPTVTTPTTPTTPTVTVPTTPTPPAAAGTGDGTSGATGGGTGAGGGTGSATGGAAGGGDDTGPTGGTGGGGISP